MRIAALTCPSWTGEHLPLPAALRPVQVPERPGRDDLADLLHAADRVIVAGTDADLAAVAVRLLRTETLARTELAYLPSTPDSPATQVWSLPTDPAAALRRALTAPARPAPLVRDDNGGVLLGRGELHELTGESYCDAELVLRGTARSFTVTPSAPDGVEVRVTTGGPLRRRTQAATGRAVQTGCISARVICDGVEHPRPVTRWTWYKHTEDLLLVH
jgi:hypothetical protein